MSTLAAGAPGIVLLLTGTVGTFGTSPDVLSPLCIFGFDVSGLAGAPGIVLLLAVTAATASDLFAGIGT